MDEVGKGVEVWGGELPVLDDLARTAEAGAF